MANQICPKSEKCPVFNIIEGTMLQMSYKNLFCTAGPEAYQSCKRFQISERHGLVPDELLPNDERSIENIEECMRRDGLFDK